MIKALRLVSVERGLDVRDFALCAFGGAGPVHAAALAQELGIPKVIVPFASGVFSAYGILVSDVQLDYSRTHLLRVSEGGEEAEAEVTEARVMSSTRASRLWRTRRGSSMRDTTECTAMRCRLKT